VTANKLEMEVLKIDGNEPAVLHVMRPVRPAEHAVVLLPAIAGINPYVADRAARLRDAGYIVAVADYFGPDRERPDLSTPESINAAVAAIDDRVVLQNIEHSIDWFGKQGIARTQVGVLGFCIGGSYAALSACVAQPPACAITYYGQLRYPEHSAVKPRGPIDAAADMAAPFLGHFGDMDRLIDENEIAEFSARLRGAQRHHEICVYRGAPHAFDEWFMPTVFRPVASAEAWSRTLTFLDWHLRQRLPANTPVPRISTGD
jgi:carboxymethylenebutenolidase